MKNLKLEFFFHPGWAYGGGFFKAWSTQFEQWGGLQIFDRNYFPEEENAFFHGKMESIGPVEHDIQRVVMTHSLGLHLVPEELLKSARWIVILSGFGFFHPREEKEKRKSEYVIQKMLKRLQESPQVTIRKFYQNCFFPQDPPTFAVPQTLNVERLFQDLEFLNVHVWEAFEEIENKEILLVHGEEDQIVSIEQAVLLQQQIPKSQLAIIPKAGHALPLTHRKECYHAIKNMISKTAA